VNVSLHQNEKNTRVSSITKIEKRWSLTEMNYTKTIFLLFLLLSLSILPSGLHAQNLVPNPGFEDFFEESKGHALISNVKEWYNTNQSQPAGLFGTPDHMYAAKRFDGSQRNDAYFAPHQGLSSAGVITYMQRIRNYREYLSIRLKESLKMGKKYKVTFYISSGNHTAFGNIGTNGFGIYFSQVPVKQYVHEPLSEKPQYMLKDIFFKTEWQEISFTLEVDRPYRYLTFGNFLRDYQLDKRYYNYDIDPQSYIYIDDVSVELIEEEPEEEIVAETPPSVDPEIPDHPDLEGRGVEIQSNFQIEKGKIVIKIWDLREVDGYVVSLKFNGEWVLRNYMLKKRKKKVKIYYRSDMENALIFFAHTLGEEPPNTAAISIKSGKSKRRLNIRSDLNYCGAIQFRK